MSTDTKPKHLGTQNAWRGRAYPPEFQRCRELGHQCPGEIKDERVGACLHRYTCTPCNISWESDSSG